MGFANALLCGCSGRACCESVGDARAMVSIVFCCDSEWNMGSALITLLLKFHCLHFVDTICAISAQFAMEMMFRVGETRIRIFDVKHDAHDNT